MSVPPSQYGGYDPSAYAQPQYAQMAGQPPPPPPPPDAYPGDAMHASMQGGYPAAPYGAAAQQGGGWHGGSDYYGGQQQMSGGRDGGHGQYASSRRRRSRSRSPHRRRRSRSPGSSRRNDHSRERSYGHEDGRGGGWGGDRGRQGYDRRRPRGHSFEGSRGGGGGGGGRGRSFAAQPSSTLMVRNIPDEADPNVVRDALGEFQAMDVRLVYHRDTGDFRGFGFVQFPSVELATAAITKYAGSASIQDNGAFLTILGKPVYLEYGESRGGRHSHGQAPRLDWLCSRCGTQNFARRSHCFKCNVPKDDSCQDVRSDAKVPPPMEDGPPQATLVVRGLGPVTDEESLLAKFREFAPAVEARVVRDRATNISRGFAFIEFPSVQLSTHVLHQVRSLPSPLVVDKHPVRVAYARSEFRRDSRRHGGEDVNMTAWAQRMLEQHQHAAGVPAAAATAAISAPPPDLSKLNARLPAKEWPDCFEKSGASFVFDSRTGFYYDESCNFYYDTTAKLYLNGTTHKYYKYNDATDGYDEHVPPPPAGAAPDPATVAAFVESLRAPPPPPPPSAAPVPAGVGNALAQSALAVAASQVLQAKAEESKATAGAPPGVVLAAGRGRGRGRGRPSSSSFAGRVPVARHARSKPSAEVASAMGKWGARQKELADDDAGTGQVAPASASSAAVGSEAPAAATSKPAAASAAPTAAATATTAAPAGAAAKAKTPVCLVCRRKFKSFEVLRLHCEKSDLHKKNLEALAKKKALEAAATSAPEAQYRDRAAERRKLFKQPAKAKLPPKRRDAGRAPKSNPVDKERAALERQVEMAKQVAAKPIDESNVGNKMLRKMGWSGAGLGKNEQGITAPLDAVEGLGGQAANVRTGVGAASAGFAINPNDSYKVKLKKTMMGRFGTTEGAGAAKKEDDGWQGMRHKTSFSM